MTWEQIYNFFGIAEFIYFISSPQIQRELLPVKLVFILFTLFFFCAMMYFYFKSSYLKYNVLEDVVEIFSWQPYGSGRINKVWNKIIKKIDGGNENEYKLAIIEADNFLYKILEESGLEGETFEEIINNTNKKVFTNSENILSAHSIRNLIVYNPDYKLDLEVAKRILGYYEKAIRNV